MTYNTIENDLRRLSEGNTKVLSGTGGLVDVADNRRTVQDDGRLLGIGFADHRARSRQDAGDVNKKEREGKTAEGSHVEQLSEQSWSPSLKSPGHLKRIYIFRI